MGPWRRWLLASATLVCAVAIAACGSSSSSSSSSGSSSGSSASSSSSPSGGASAAPALSADPAVQKLVPAAIKSKGTLTVASDASYAPNEFIAQDGHTVIGMDADLVKAIGGVMGVKNVQIVNVPFASILAGLQAGKYDLGASSFTDTKEREKTVNFVTYFTAGESFYTKASGGTTIGTISELCGHSVAVEQGTTEKDDATAQSKKCQSQGKGAVSVSVFPDQNGANLAVSSGRAQLGFADSPVAEYQVKKSNGQFKLVGQPYANAPYGLAVAKTSGLAPAVLASLKVLMKNGTYVAILKRWGIEAGAISAPKINGATS